MAMLVAWTLVPVLVGFRRNRALKTESEGTYMYIAV